jgi:flagellar assembly protein FliH
LYKGKLVQGATVSDFVLPSFEGAARPTRAGNPGERKSRTAERTQADIEREGYARGFEAGKKAGSDIVVREAAPLLAGLRTAVEGMGALREQVVREAEPQVVDLALAIARRIVIGELSEKPERIAAIVKEAVRRIERTGPVTVRVHPDLSNLIKGLQSEATDIQAELLLDVDPSVPPAGPIVTGTTEEVLTDVDEQIRVIAEELRGERAAR